MLIAKMFSVSTIVLTYISTAILNLDFDAHIVIHHFIGSFVATIDTYQFDVTDSFN